jgi:hypothetical protein
MSIKKGYDNPEEWEKIENQKTPKLHIITEDVLREKPEDLSDIELTETEDVEEDFLKEQPEKDDFSDVLQLTQYNDSLLPSNQTDFIIAEYKDIDVVEVSKKHEIEAKKFVNKITKFILEFNDVVLSEAHKNYLRQVSDLQLQHLSDLLYLTDVNKQILNNIVARINATQAEDYAILNSYNNLATNHLKLIKELQNAYRAIPTVIKKAKADVLCNQELGDNDGQEGIDGMQSKEFGD